MLCIWGALLVVHHAAHAILAAPTRAMNGTEHEPSCLQQNKPQGCKQMDTCKLTLSTICIAGPGSHAVRNQGVEQCRLPLPSHREARRPA